MSSMLQWWEGVKGTKAVAHAKGHAVETGRVVRSYGEGVIAGAVLGAANASIAGGLDQKVGMSPFPIPLDGAAAAAFGIGAIVLANEEAGVGVSATMRQVGANCAAIWSFRKSDAFVRAAQGSVTGAIKSIGKPKIHGEFGAEGGTKALAQSVESDPLIGALSTL